MYLSAIVGAVLFNRMHASPLIALNEPALQNSGSSEASPVQTDYIDQTLTIQWVRKTITTDPPGAVFEYAQATFGSTVLTCDRLTLDLEPGHRHLLAEGHVHVLDPDGTIDGKRIFIDWINRTGSGEDIDVHIAGFMLHADEIILAPKLKELRNIYATPCGGEDMPIAIESPRALIQSTGDARIFSPRILIMGRHVLTLKEYDISPGRRGNGQPLPSFNYSKASGFSGTWTPSMLLNDQTVVNGGLHVAQLGRSSEDLQVSESLLPVSVAPGGFVPYSDFSERFGFGYFNNVYISSPGVERLFTTARRESVSIGTLWNEGPAARAASISMAKPIDVTWENAQPFGDFGLYTQVKLQRIEQIDGPREDRALETASLTFPNWFITPTLYTDCRLDGQASLGSIDRFGWGHAQLGLVARPSERFRIGAAYELSSQFGTPLFPTDPLVKSRSLDLRGDLQSGPHRLSLLLKFEPRRMQLYDTEFEVGQAVKCFEPYFIYRSFPRGFGFGLRLRVDELMRAIRRHGGATPQNSPSY